MATNRFAVDIPFVLIPQYFGCIVFDRSMSRYLPFDAESTVLLKLSKHMPFPVMVGEMSEPEKREQAEAFFDHFSALGFFTFEGYFAGAILNVQPAADHLTGPLAVHLEVASTCNLSCKHCFAGKLPRQEKILSLSEIEPLLASMAHMGSFRLGLTGGEPLLRPDLFEIIDLALSYGLHPCITTNGTLITEDIAKGFGERNLVWLNVSLDGASAAGNDFVRGSGTFDRVMENLKVLARHSRFTLAFTIMRTNAHEAKACAELARRAGAATAVFRPLYPVGTAQDHLSELMPSFMQYNQALTELSQMADGDMHTVEPFSPFHRTETQAISYDNYGCGAGNLVCSVSAAGDVNPCSFLGPSFVAGNIRECSLEEIWHRSEVFCQMRAFPGGTTTTFSGGCRARAMVLNGSANAPDPWMNETLIARQCVDDVIVHDPRTILELSKHHAGDRNGS
jgi:radical SAM protein with 4Fe4S-binding SPASM domain